MSNINEFFEIIRHEYNNYGLQSLNKEVGTNYDQEFDMAIGDAVQAIRRMSELRYLKREADRK